MLRCDSGGDDDYMLAGFNLLVHSFPPYLAKVLAGRSLAERLSARCTLNVGFKGGFVVAKGWVVY